MSQARTRRQRGQTLVIFTLLASLLLSLVGVAIESVRLYILSAEALRAAEAGALAGVLYLPDYYNTPAPDGQDALLRACAAAQQHAITPCPAGQGQIGTQPTRVAGQPYQLAVTVTEPAQLFLLALLGITNATVSRTATAEYLPPLALGSRASSFGDLAGQHFYARSEGPLEIKERGDAFTPLLEEGPSSPLPFVADPAWPCCAGPTLFNRWPTSGWATTNHPQYGSGPIANPDQHAPGFTGVLGQGAYNYEIVVPSGATPVEVWLFSPAFAPSDAAPTGDTLGSACYDPAYNPTSTCTVTDQAGEYLQKMYSIYAVPLPFERSADQLVFSQAYPSVDLYAADLTRHQCSGQAYDPVARRCVSRPAYLYSWTPFYTLTTPGTYRLAVETTGGYGGHAYGVRLTDPAGRPPQAGVRLWAWDEMCVEFVVSGVTTTFDLAEIPAAYAGTTLTFNLFDPGDASGKVSLELLDPTGTPVVLPGWVNTVPGSNGTQLDASSKIYNGLWLHLPVAIPATYALAPGQDWWQIRYLATGVPVDTVTFSISALGSPVHLIA